MNTWNLAIFFFLYYLVILGTVGTLNLWHVSHVCVKDIFPLHRHDLKLQENRKSISNPPYIEDMLKKKKKICEQHVDVDWTSILRVGYV